MYALVERLDERELFRLSVQAFEEMRDAGITTVGEFHYLHHAGDGTDYEFDRVVLEAAAAAGIRIVLLQTYYATGGIGQPLGPAQRRFRSTDVGAYWKQMDRLESALDRRTQSLGAVAHSIRAAHSRRHRGTARRISAAPAAVPHARGGAATGDRGVRGGVRPATNAGAARHARHRWEPDRGALHPYRTGGSAAVSPGGWNRVRLSAYRGEPGRRVAPAGAGP